MKTITTAGLAAILEQAGLVYFDSCAKHYEGSIQEGSPVDEYIAAAVPAINDFFNSKESA